MARSTRVHEVWPGVHLLCTYDEERGLSFNQYLIDDERPVLVHTGGVDLVDGVIEAIERVRPIEELEYAIVTHFEADECGGLPRLLDRAPSLRPVCSERAADQLRGFGLHEDPLVEAGGDTLDTGDRTLAFVDYPAEMHLWNGLLPYDAAHEGLFSSDLWRRRGPVAEPVVTESIPVDEIPRDRIPARREREATAERLAALDPRWIAPGHGPVIERRPARPEAAD